MTIRFKKTMNRPRRTAAGVCLAVLFATAGAGAQVSVTKDFTGIWDQPEHESQGFVLQIVAQPGGTRQAVAYWFTYGEDGDSFWLVGQGGVEGNTIELEFLEVSGPTFLSPSNPMLRMAEVWGTGTIEFDSCNEATVEVSAADAVTGTGLNRFQITRLANIFATDCTGGIGDDLSPAVAPFEARIELVGTAAAPAASGDVEIEVEPGRAEFEVEVEDLPLGDYQVVVDGVDRGTLTVIDTGMGFEGELKLRSPADAGAALLTFDPRGAVVEIVQEDTVFLTSDAMPGGGPMVIEFKIEIELDNAGVYPDGSGELEFEQRLDRTEFKVEIEDVPAGPYGLRVGGVDRAVIDVIELMDGGTEGELEFRDPVEAGKLPLDFDPAGQLVEVVEGETVIFSAEVPDETDIGGGAGNPDDGADGPDDGADDPDDGADDPDDGADDPDDGADDPDDGADDPNDNGDEVEVEVDLVNSGLDADASGRARLRTRPDRTDFNVEVEDLDDGDYELFVGATQVATITVAGGEGEVEFRDPVEPGKLPLDFDPRGMTISVEQNGEVFLSVDFPAE